MQGLEGCAEDSGIYSQNKRNQEKNFKQSGMCVYMCVCGLITFEFYKFYEDHIGYNVNDL